MRREILIRKSSKSNGANPKSFEKKYEFLLTRLLERRSLDNEMHLLNATLTHDDPLKSMSATEKDRAVFQAKAGPTDRAGRNDPRP